MLSPTETSTATINPTSNDLVLETGSEEEQTVTVTIPPSVGVNKADVYILADTTGSMGAILNAVKSGANDIVGAPYSGIDIAFGVGNYRDFTDMNPPFAPQVQPTTTNAAVTAGIQSWNADGGGDMPESQLFALHTLAEAPGGSTIGWRSDSKRIVVWFGDAPGHDPIRKEQSGLGFDITTETVKNRLAEENITVIAISVHGNRLDASGNQATQIADATGGKHVEGINSSEIVDTIINLIDEAIKDIGEVRLVPTSDVAPFVASITPSSFTNLPGEENHVLNFTVNCQGVNPCADDEMVHTGAFDAIADGANIASQAVRITVPACNPNRLTQFILVNADTNEDIRVIEEGDILDLSTLPSALNIRVVPGDAVASVTFNMTPLNQHVRGEENRRPFSLFGDTGEDGRNFNAGSFAVGPHSLTASPFSELRAQGEAGEPLTVNFQVVNA